MKYSTTSHGEVQNSRACIRIKTYNMYIPNIPNNKFSKNIEQAVTHIIHHIPNGSDFKAENKLFKTFHK